MAKKRNDSTAPTEIDPNLLAKMQQNTDINQPKNMNMTMDRPIPFDTKSNFQFNDYQSPTGTVTFTKYGKQVTMTKAEYEDFIAAQKGGRTDTITGKGTKDAVALQQKTAAQAQGEQLAPQVGQIDENIVPPIGTPINFGEAAGAGLANVAPGLLGGVVGGAVVGGGVGAAAGLGIGAVPGAIVGGLIGGISTFLVGARSNMKNQLSGEITASGMTVSKTERNLRALITDTNQHPENAANNLEMFNYQLSLLEQEHSKLKLETQRDLNKWLSEDGKTQLRRFEMFDSPGGSREFLTMQMQQALLNPDPSKNLITMDDLQEIEGGAE